MPCGRRRGARAREAGLRGALLGHGIRAPGRLWTRARSGRRTGWRSAPRHSSPVTARRPTARYQESYRHHIDSGSTLAAARDTFWLGMLHNMGGTRRSAVAGWRGAPGCCTTRPRMPSSTATRPCTRCSGTSSPASFRGPRGLRAHLGDRATLSGGEPRRPGPVGAGSAASSTAGGCRRVSPCSTRPWSV